MNAINSLPQAPGFDQQRYDSLIQQAKSEKIDTGMVNELLLNAVRSGKNFDQAMQLVRSEIPGLATPTNKSTEQLKNWTTLPSPAWILSMITQFAADQRRQNQEIAWQETEAMVKSMEGQADKMRDTAVTQLILGCVSGVVQIGVGAAQLGIGISAAKGANAALKGADTAAKGTDTATKATATATDEAADAASKAANDILTKANIKSSAFGSMGAGASKMMDSGAQYENTIMQAKAKELEADQERMRAARDATKELSDALATLIQKTLSAHNEIIASTNQARAKILA
ncbi:MAG: type III secretion system translocon subunit SctB [Deltaproteobacteria bacterium]|jgi:hypothetical protein|nr:type III secretion system translocon subunit SctB [Deltaproteobacteria bacterium]